MKNLHIMALLLLCTLMACSKEDDLSDTDLPGLGGETWEKTALDYWLDSNFVAPYNIEVKYRFDRYELSLNKDLVPVIESQVETVMETINKTWVQPYVDEAGSTFFKKYCQKQFVLVGSPQYNSNNTITLGTAEGGRKIVLFALNYFSLDDEASVKEMLHTIHHEFAHILHQTIMYPVEFKSVSTGYTGSWNDYSLDDALALGFVTQYARSGPDEDFVEMVSTMLVEGKSGFDDIVDSAPAAGQAKLRTKEEIVVRYFKENWNIDFYSLQTRTRNAINNL